MLTQLTILPMACLALMFTAGCGDSLANGTPVDVEKAFALSDADSLALTTHVWKGRTDLRYTSFLEVNEDRAGGFLCHNDGKSVSGEFSFLKLGDGIVMTGPAGHGQGPNYVENLRFEGDDLVISGSEKGLAYTFTYAPISELPTICKRIKAGEKPTLEEYMASWDPER